MLLSTIYNNILTAFAIPVIKCELLLTAVLWLPSFRTNPVYQSLPRSAPLQQEVAVMLRSAHH